MIVLRSLFRYPSLRNSRILLHLLIIPPSPAVVTELGLCKNCEAPPNASSKDCARMDDNSTMEAPNQFQLRLQFLLHPEGKLSTKTPTMEFSVVIIFT
mmetsp:Transcript_16490/g.47431  ORF Transcript_16490/g.47431 Transcript_16490/m.47431 type:complete len:98 (-) Transcript_16490:27-320(-)